MSFNETAINEATATILIGPAGIAPSRPRRDLEDPDLELLTLVQRYLAHQQLGTIPSRAEIEAWHCFYSQYNCLICYYIRQTFHSLSIEDVNDCIQEVWKELVVQLPRFRYDPLRGRFSTWLRTLARNKAVDAVRQRRRASRDGRGDRFLASLATRAGDDPSVRFEQVAAQDELRAEIDALSRRLPRRTARVVRLRCIEGRSVAEVAALLELPPAHVWTLNHRGLKQLRQLLAPRWQAGIPGRQAQGHGSLRE